MEVVVEQVRRAIGYQQILEGGSTPRLSQRLVRRWGGRGRLSDSPIGDIEVDEGFGAVDPRSQGGSVHEHRLVIGPDDRHIHLRLVVVLGYNVSIP